jgi:hypothetical protein
MSKQSARRRHRDGRYHTPDADEISDEVPPFGEVRVPLLLADAAHPRHWPGYATPLTDSEAARLRDGVRVARDEMIDRARSAWSDGKRRREPPDDDDDDDDEDDTNDVRAPSIRARDEMVSQLRDAWKRPAQVGPGPGATLAAPSFGPAPVRPVPGAPADDDDPQQRRDAVAREYATTISNAWKMTNATRYPQTAEVGAGITNVVEPAGSDPQRAVRNERELEAMKGGRDARGHG